MDIDALQEVVETITYCDIHNEGSCHILCDSTHDDPGMTLVIIRQPHLIIVEFQRTDPNFLKLFQLSQMLLEYLLHAQEYLWQVVNGPGSFMMVHLSISRCDSV